MNESDDSLIEAALTGRAEAFGILVRRYQERAYGVALGVLADFALALDATQEALLCAYCDLPRLRDRRRFSAWLCGIARNTAFEILRDRQRRERLAREAASRGGERAESPPAADLATRAEERSLVQTALQRVREKDREALVLYYVDGLDYAQVCECLAVSVGTLKGRLQRGRAALKKELAMVEQACKDNTPDERFARKLDEAIRILGAPGPASHHIPSSWLQSLIGQVNRLARSEEDGFRISVALSHSGTARTRYYVVTVFGLRREDRALRELERMLEDRSARVRRQALRWYASRIHPEPAVTGPHAIGSPSDASPAGLESLLHCLADENHNVRFVAVGALAAYAKSRDPRVLEALTLALKDPKHKVRHAAARVLGTACPGCRRSNDRGTRP